MVLLADVFTNIALVLQQGSDAPICVGAFLVATDKLSSQYFPSVVTFAYF